MDWKICFCGLMTWISKLYFSTFFCFPSSSWERRREGGNIEGVNVIFYDWIMQTGLWISASPSSSSFPWPYTRFYVPKNGCPTTSTERRRHYGHISFSWNCPAKPSYPYTYISLLYCNVLIRNKGLTFLLSLAPFWQGSRNPSSSLKSFLPACLPFLESECQRRSQRSSILREQRQKSNFFSPPSFREGGWHKADRLLQAFSSRAARSPSLP